MLMTFSLTNNDDVQRKPYSEVQLLACNSQFRLSLTVLFLLPCDAMCKRSLHCRPVSVRLSVTLVYCVLYPDG